MNRLKIFCIILFIPFTLFAKDIPNGFKNITLGMSFDEAKQELLKDPDFGYHGDRDVSLLPNSNKVLIETSTNPKYTSSFLTDCYFQFNDEKLYIITININQDKIDYYSIFTTLCEKYGMPDTVSPQGSTWKTDDITMSLEKPLTLKYIDNNTFQELQNYSNIQHSAEEKTKEQFLDEL